MEVKIESAILRWNRERFGISPEILSNKVGKHIAGVTPALVRGWEDGTAKITFTQLKHLAKVSKRPLAVFFLASPPPEKDNPPDRRTFGSRIGKALSPEINVFIRRARRVQDIASELKEELQLPNKFSYGRFSLTDDPVNLAAKIRADFSFPVSDQKTFSKAPDLFTYLRTKIERTGALTLKTTRHNRFPLTDARAFSLVDAEPFVVVVNGSDADVAQIFSLLHEFAHLLVRQAGICNNFRDVAVTDDDVRRLEAFCNRFAAAFLVPADDLRADEHLIGRQSIVTDELDTIVEPLARTFKVSRPVILGRLLALSLISQNAYIEKTREWDSKKPKPKKRGGRTDPSRDAISGHGAAFSSLVIRAYKEKKISYSGIADYLNVRAKYIPRLENLLTGKNA